MNKPPLQTMHNIANLLKNPPYHEVDIMCDAVMKMCEDFDNTPYAKPFAKLIVVANALRSKSAFDFKSVKELLLKQCLVSAQEVADIAKRSAMES